MQSCLNFVCLALAVLPVAFLGNSWGRGLEPPCPQICPWLRQEPGFFDSGDAAAATAEIIGGISKDASVIQEVLAEKVHVHRPRPTRPPPSASSLIDA
ncbi:hypothetical protein PVAP13_7KG156110 [Panicum virgatum]|uniref:Uncharacterized protein n=1 Tax=Panicum virgatum TaxID=38727 RepID=A0A8T0QMU8_PANVG|nr:hypothetical protein PVAP13_7KG156110 [Panicum virgatum]